MLSHSSGRRRRNGAPGVVAFLVLPLLSPGCGAPSQPTPQPGFTDVTTQAGIRFVHDNGAYGKKYYPERMGSGGAFVDVNGDGLPDVFLVNGSPMPGHPRPQPHSSRLYVNQGNGTFADRTAGSGLESIGYGMGAAVGDVNNDGREDLYVTRLGRNSLYLNRGNGTFSDVTGAAGVVTGGYSTSAAFLDYDRDGFLDLYVCRYIPWASPADDHVCRNPKGEREYCTVHLYPGTEHRLYHNRGLTTGAPKFEDVTSKAGVVGHPGRGLAVVCADYDDDGNDDIFVANDETPNFLWRNDGHGRFVESAAATGFAYNERGIATSGMGLDVADADGNGTDDLIESDFQGQRKTLYVNDGHGFFTPNGANEGLGDMPVNRLGFGIGFLDFDLDGWPDIFIANGHVNDHIGEFSAGVTFAQTAQLFRNVGKGVYADTTSVLGAYGRTPFVGRGAAFGDYDNDGDTDILVMNNAGPAALLRNDTPHRNHWIGIRCIGEKSNRSGIGVRVLVNAGGRVLTRETRTASSYLSAGDPRLLFGLGASGRIDHLTLRWPSGAVQEWANLAPDRYYTFREGGKGE